MSCEFCGESGVCVVCGRDNDGDVVGDTPGVLKRRYLIAAAMEWQLYKESLNQAITDRAEGDMGIYDEEGFITVTIEGEYFVATFVPEPRQTAA